MNPDADARQPAAGRWRELAVGRAFELEAMLLLMRDGGLEARVVVAGEELPGHEVPLEELDAYFGASCGQASTALPGRLLVAEEDLRRARQLLELIPPAALPGATALADEEEPELRGGPSTRTVVLGMFLLFALATLLVLYAT